MKLATSSDPQNHPKIEKYAFFEILCLLEFVCFQDYHFWVQNVICGSDLSGIYEMGRFGCYIAKKRSLLEPWSRP